MGDPGLSFSLRFDFWSAQHLKAILNSHHLKSCTSDLEMDISGTLEECEGLVTLAPCL